MDEERKMTLRECPKCKSKAIELCYPKPKTILIQCMDCLISYQQKYLKLSREQLLKIMIDDWNTRTPVDVEALNVEVHKQALIDAEESGYNKGVMETHAQITKLRR